MNRIYAHISARVSDDWTLIIEDDVIPPTDAIGRLFAAVNGADVCAVSGAYESRDRGYWLVWKQLGCFVWKKGKGVEYVQGTGFGCLLVQSRQLRSHTWQTDPDHHWFDFHFFEQVAKSGWRVRIDWSIECEHLAAKREPELQFNSPASVEIVCAGHNAAAWIEEALESALLQNHRCEVIFADDCSVDGTPEIAEQMSVRVLRSRVRRGLCDARNRGAAAASAEWIVFLDADDVLPPDFVARHLAAADASCPFVYGPVQTIGAFRQFWPIPAWERYDRWFRYSVSMSALWRRSVFMAAGQWDGSLPSLWDYDLAFRCAQFGTPRESTATLLCRQHLGSISAHSGEKDTRWLSLGDPPGGRG